MRAIEQTASQPSPKKSWLYLLFGRPLSSEEDVKERIGSTTGIPVFGLDALSSAAYGPEAALTVLIPLSLAGVYYIFPLSLTIIALLAIVYFSYRQTIAAYPNGGSSYTVASENLGERAGLLAGASLMLDYVLNVCVGISAGVGALISALPALQPHTLLLCLSILAILTLVNLRGVREAGLALTLPTFVFVVSLGVVILFGLFKAISHAGHPLPAAPIPRPGPAESTVSLWLLIKAFSSGCTAMTGVEAVSNGVPVFREPRVKNARATLTTIVAILILLLGGITYLCRVYGIAATPPGQSGYQSILSQVTTAVFGRGVFYYVTIAAILSVLSLSANTSFADFPRLCRVIADKRYLPFPFAIRGRRLVFSFGVYVLAGLSAFLLIIFQGVTDRLIPLFAIGAFMAFTLSQAGMVMHWRKHQGRHARASMFINGFGAIATGLTTCIVLVAKFTEGAWLTILAISGLILLMTAIHNHYEAIRRETTAQIHLQLKPTARPLVILPMECWNRVSEKALRFAYTLSGEVLVLHVVPQDEEGEQSKGALTTIWEDYIEGPIRNAGFTPPRLVLLRSPYRVVLTPIIDFILKVESEHPHRMISVLVPELMERRWYYYLLHNQRANALKVMLYLKGNGRIIVVNVPWYLRS